MKVVAVSPSVEAVVVARAAAPGRNAAGSEERRRTRWAQQRGIEVLVADGEAADRVRAGTS